MRRREFITLLGGAATCPLAARAQQAAMPVIGFLAGASPDAYSVATAPVVPTAATFGLLVDPTNPNTEFETADMQSAADLLGYRLVVASASTASEVDTAFTKLVQQRIDALAVAAQGFFVGDRSHQLAELALQHRVPAIYAWRVTAVAGGLISYGGSVTEAYHQAGIYTGRILKGDKPADLPVQIPTKFDLVINLRTANTLGLTIPPGILAIADEVIE